MEVRRAKRIARKIQATALGAAEVSDDEGDDLIDVTSRIGAPVGCRAPEADGVHDELSRIAQVNAVIAAGCVAITTCIIVHRLNRRRRSIRKVPRYLQAAIMRPHLYPLEVDANVRYRCGFHSK